MALDIEHFGTADSRRVEIVATGTVNAVASSVYQTWAFRRAEIAGHTSSPFRLPSGNLLTFARVRQLHPMMVGPDRVVTLAVEALEQLAPSIARFPEGTRLGVGLCLPPRMDPQGSDVRGRRAGRAVERRVVAPLLERGLDVQAKVFATAHASFGFAALELGRLISRRTLDAGLLLGVDTYYDPFVLEGLFAEQRVLDTEWRESFVPGEAASAVLLSGSDAVRELGLEVLGELESVGTDHEVATRNNDVGLLANGLSRPAVECAKRLRSSGRALDYWLSDATGEGFRVQELQLAWPRAAKIAMTPDGIIELLPNHFGEIGAATMPTGVALALEALRRGDPAGSTSVITGSSDEGERSVVMVRARAPS